MRAIVTGILAAVILAVVGAMILDTGFQESAQDRNRTSGVRL